MSYSIENRNIRNVIAEINESYGYQYPNCRNSRTKRRIKANWLFNAMSSDLWKVLNKEVKTGDIDAYTWTEICDAAQDAEWLTSLVRNKRSKFVPKHQPTSYLNQGFKYDMDGYVQVYTDGACLRNGSDFPSAGIGIYFNHNHPSNVAKPLYPSPFYRPVTNNQAEIKAATEAFYILKENGVKSATISSDSLFLVNAMTKWIFDWLKNGWATANGSEVINKSDLRYLLRASEGFNIKWVHVRGHSKVVGNLEAHKLAQIGARMY